MQKTKICFVAAAEMSVKAFLLDHIRSMEQKYHITVITNTEDENFLRPFGLSASVIPVYIERKISPIKDLKALGKLYRIFRKNRFDVVHSIMPKSGLLSMVAAYFAHVPTRIHTFTGQVWATREGFKRYFLKCFDILLSACATFILVDSHSQREFIIKEGVVSEAKSTVIANGSISGVDTKVFSPNPLSRNLIRNKFTIADGDVVFLFVGRLTLDKGLIDLSKAFSRVCRARKDVHLLVVGPDEEGVKIEMIKNCENNRNRMHFENFTDTPEQYMAAADVFCLPSYREGFGVVAIEAASCGVPAIGTRIYGVVDAIEDGLTGFLYDPHNVDMLAALMLKMVEEPELRIKLGEKARERLESLFSKEIVISAFVNFYDSLLRHNEKN